jgi:eukaryotic-like serine/threonine-protein kinase
MTGGSSEVAVGVREGDILMGKYRIDKILGAGGMGVVVAAHHIRLDEKVAIKFLLPETLGSSEAVARFEREARAAVKIKSEHVARVSDVGTLENGAPYIVMEYLEGGDLSAWVHQRGPLPVEQAVEFVLQACEAIADAHGLGIVHRDLKPANLFCIRGSDNLLSIKVLDFGISKVTGGAAGPDMGMTKTKSVMGSPFYMSPEQMRSAKDVDARTDIWALGVILYELLTGSAPFTGDTLPEVCVKIATETPPPLRNLRPDAPAGLEEVILKCLQKDRTLRYGNVADFAVALAPFGPKRSRTSVERISRVIQTAGLSTANPVLFSSAPPSAMQPAGVPTAASWGRTASPAARKAAKLVAAFLAVAATTATGLFIFVGRPSERASGQPSAGAGLVATAPPVALAPAANAVVAAPALTVPPAAVAPVASQPAPQGVPVASAQQTPSAPTGGATKKAAPARPPAAQPRPPSAPAAPRPAPAKPTNDWGGRL